ncbi:hypothetical protein RI367_000905 [Sorochytrium milnesiophthora]
MSAQWSMQQVAPRALVEPLALLAKSSSRSQVITDTFADLSAFQDGLLERYSDDAASEFGLTDATAPDAVRRNRWSDILPFNYSRVHLRDVASKSDYINASYIRPKPDRSEKELARYIATQGPLPDTFGDFWSMVWHEGTKTIVMLTNEIERGTVKCHRYFPAMLAESMSFPRNDGSTLRVTLTASEQLASNAAPSSNSSSLLGAFVKAVQLRYKTQPRTVQCLTRTGDLTFRTFKLTYTAPRTADAAAQSAPPNSQSRDVYHIHFGGWPDHGVPRDHFGVLTIMEFARYLNIGCQHPMVLHCSAGCGRTGTLITIDTVCRQIEENKPLELQVQDLVLDTVISLRRDRISMVQTAGQLEFCYLAIAQYLALTGVLILSPVVTSPTATRAASAWPPSPAAQQEPPSVYQHLYRNTPDLPAIALGRPADYHQQRRRTSDDMDVTPTPP